MELFSILCDTCAAKLRVTKPNAVGQVLACPKCANMIRVVAPLGWEPSPEVAASLSSEQLEKIRSSISSEGFDDIDDVLKAAPIPQKRPKPSKPPGAEQRSTTKAPNLQQPRPKATSQPAAQGAADNGPMLPTNEWTSQQSQQRRKLIGIVAAVLGTVIIVGGLTAAYFVNASNQLAKNVVNEDDTTPENDTPDPTVDETDAEEPAKTDTSEPEITGQPETTEPVDPPAPAITDNPPLDVTDDVTETPDENKETETNPDVALPLPSNPLASLPTEPEKVEKADDITKRDLLGNPLEDDSNLGNLAELLDQANTSISEMQDLASEIQDQELIGISKYFIAFPAPLEVDIDNRLETRCAGIHAKETPLISVLREITAFTGVPIALDSENLRFADRDFLMPVSMTLQQTEEERTSFAMALEAAITQHDLIQTLSPDRNVIVLTAHDPSLMTREIYELPKFASNDVLGKSMVGLIRMLIAPETWTRDNDPGTVTLTGNELTVHQTADVHYQLKRFFEGLAAVEAGEPTPTLWASAQPALAKPTGMSRTLPLTLEEYLTTIQKNAGVVVLVDWPELAMQGWNPQTMVPGNLLEDSVHQTMREIARSMKLALRAVDENTLELTSFRALMNRPDLEIFYYGDIIKGALTEKQLFAIVNDALGQQFKSNPNVRMEYFPQIQCVVAIAPQTLQRQIELILDQLRKVGT